MEPETKQGGEGHGGEGGGTYRPQAVLVAPVCVGEQPRTQLERPKADGCLGRGEVDLSLIHI